METTHDLTNLDLAAELRTLTRLASGRAIDLCDNILNIKLLLMDLLTRSVEHRNNLDALNKDYDELIDLMEQVASLSSDFLALAPWLEGHDDCKCFAPDRIGGLLDQRHHVDANALYLELKKTYDSAFQIQMMIRKMEREAEVNG